MISKEEGNGYSSRLKHRAGLRPRGSVQAVIRRPRVLAERRGAIIAVVASSSARLGRVISVGGNVARADLAVFGTTGVRAADANLDFPRSSTHALSVNAAPEESPNRHIP